MHLYTVKIIFHKRAAHSKQIYVRLNSNLWGNGEQGRLGMARCKARLMEKARNVQVGWFLPQQRP